MSYEELAKVIIDKLGGINNIQDLSHCMTRLRVILYDDTLVDVEALDNISGVMRVIVVGGQYQIVIGTAVDDVYAAAKAILNQQSSTKDNIAQESSIPDMTEKTYTVHDPVEKGFLHTLNKIISLGVTTLSGIFTPLIPAMLGAGLIKVVLIIANQFFHITETNTTYALLDILQNAFFYYMPVMIAWSAAKRFQVNTVMSLLVVGLMISPDLAALFAKGSVDFLGITVTPVSYTSSIIPPILAVYLLKWVDVILNKVIPTMMKSVLVPLLTLLITVPITLIALGPLGYWGGVVMSNIIIAFYDFSPILSGALIGATWNLLLIAGMHMVILTLVRNQNLAILGIDKVTVAYCASLMCQIAAGLAVAMRTKNKALKEEAYSLTLTSFFAGNVIEPVMYGINIKYKRPFYFTIVGGLVGGAIIGASGAGITAPVAFSIYTLPAFFGTGFAGLMLGTIVGSVITFLLTYKFGLREEDIVEIRKDENNQQIIKNMKESEQMQRGTTYETV